MQVSSLKRKEKEKSRLAKKEVTKLSHLFSIATLSKEQPCNIRPVIHLVIGIQRFTASDYGGSF